MTSRTHILASLLVVGLALAWAVDQLGVVARLGNGLSPIADAYSESNAIRAAHGYVREGWWSHAGLPDTTYGRLFPESGHEAERPDGEWIYTHYPQGPMWTVALMTEACGVGQVGCFRALPIAAGTLCAVLMGLGLVSWLGAVRGALATLLLMAVPMFGNMMHGLYYQGYALSLLGVQIALVGRASDPGRLPSKGLVGALFGLGFAQGWMSFDYFFLVAFAAVPFAVLSLDWKGADARRTLCWLVLAPASGFALAHGLHLLQVVAWYGSVGEALGDLLGSASERFDPERAPELDRVPVDVAFRDPLAVAGHYLLILATHRAHFGFRVAYLFLGALVFLWAVRGRRLDVPGVDREIRFPDASRAAAAIAMGLLVSFAWIMLMRGHSAVHQHFIPRHLFLAYAVTVIALLRSARLARRPGGRGTGGGTGERSGVDQLGEPHVADGPGVDTRLEA